MRIAISTLEKCLKSLTEKKRSKWTLSLFEFIFKMKLMHKRRYTKVYKDLKEIAMTETPLDNFLTYLKKHGIKYDVIKQRNKVYFKFY